MKTIIQKFLFVWLGLILANFLYADWFEDDIDENLTYSDAITITTVCNNNGYLPDAQGYLGCDYIKLKNTSGGAKNIGGYSISTKKTYSAAKSEGELFTLPSYTLSAGASVYVFFSEDFPSSGWVQGPSFTSCRTSKFNLGANDNVRLFNPKGARVVNWKSGDNSPSGPSPARTLLRINEVCYDCSNVTDPDGNFDCDWIELYNAGNTPLNLASYTLAKKKDYAAASAENTLLHLPNYTLQPNSYFLVFLSKDYPANMTVRNTARGIPAVRSNLFSLGVDEITGLPDDIRLFDDGYFRLSNVKGEIGVGAENTSFGATTDGQSTFQIFQNPTPGASNKSAPILRPQVRINEICYKNTLLAGPTGELDSDWVELYNYGTKPVELGGLKIGKKRDISSCGDAILTLPSRTLNAGEYVLIFFNKDLAPVTAWTEVSTGKYALRTNLISLGSTTDEIDGSIIQDSIRLFDTDGVRLSNIKGESSIGIIPDDYTYGCYQDAMAVFEITTPWADNGDGIWIRPPTFSKKPGYYAKSISVTLSNPLGGQIRYTLDGSDPTTSPSAITVNNNSAITISAREDGTKTSERTNAWIRTSPVELASREPHAAWQEPIGSILRSSPLRAVTILNTRTSKESVGTYLIGPTYANRTLPIISVTANDSALFSDEEGIYVPGLPYKNNGYGSNKWGKDNANYYQVDINGDDWEREGHIEVLEPNQSEESVNVSLGLAMHGGGTRALPKKALYCIMRSAYGDKNLTYPLIPEIGELTFKRFMLRNNGNDFYGPITDGITSHIRDAVLQRIVHPLNLTYMAYRPAIVYINGDYWGLHNIRESIDKHYYETRFGIDADNIDLLTHEEDDWSSRTVTIGRIDGDKNADEEYELFLYNVKKLPNNNLSLIYDSIDVDNYIDYTIAETFFANTDWPCNNCDFWRAHTPTNVPSGYGDGKWRWTLYDLDMAGAKVENIGGPEVNMISYINAIRAHNDNKQAAFLLSKLLRESTGKFKIHYISRYLDLLNSAFRPERTREIIAKAAEEIRSEVERDYRRWGRNFTTADWDNAVTDGLINFLLKRHEVSFSHILSLSADFSSCKQGTLILRNEDPTGKGGHFKVNTIDIEPTTAGIQSRANWSATYLTQIPVAIEAIPDSGYKFAGWLYAPNAPANREVYVNSDEPTTLVARFIPENSEYNPPSNIFESWLSTVLPEAKLNNLGTPDDIATKTPEGLSSTYLALYAFGISPTTTQAECNKQMSLTIDKDLNLTYQRTAQGDDLEYTLLCATNPKGPWNEVTSQDLTGPITDSIQNETTKTVTIPLKQATNGNQFFKLRITLKQ